MDLQSIKKIKELIKEIKVGMLVTSSSNGELSSRPMFTQKVDDENAIWFFTSNESAKTFDISRYPEVNVAYSSPEKNSYLSVQGIAMMVDDEETKKGLYSLIVKAWFPEGLKSDDLTLIKVNMKEVEYWDGTSSKIVQAYRMGKAIATGTQYVGGDHEKLGVN